ncbi:RING-H2 finger protein ATL44 [Acorus gramineus]|uniref:RING-H2 finger protein ATL44 n=1 Tax=Acorus gramineus TaxID=55184 RepID=A0AAV9BWR0_ACOGR|nr:RING-H2 finger protein ATL44 [Acorus gramineus]
MEETYHSNHHHDQTLPPPVPPPSQSPSAAASSLDYDMVVILAAMLCALVCALGLNTMLHCVVRCTRRSISDPARWVASRRLNAGLTREDLAALPVTTYAADKAAVTMEGGGCAICLVDFEEGNEEKVRVLPRCGHGFHVGCVDRWLRAHSSCPTCRRRIGPLDVATAC